jgi:hypothetical protein
LALSIAIAEYFSIFLTGFNVALSGRPLRLRRVFYLELSKQACDPSSDIEVENTGRAALQGRF